MNPQETVKKIVEIFNSGDTSKVESLFSPNYIDHQRPPFIQANGPEEFKQIVELARKSLPNLKVTIQDVVTENNKIVARLLWHSVDDTGKKIERETIDILHLANNQVIEHWGVESWSSES